MITDTPQTTARIYQFPSRPRAIERSATAGRPHRHERHALTAPMSDFGSGWYHDVAIRTDPAAPHAG